MNKHSMKINTVNQISLLHRTFYIVIKTKLTAS